MKKILLTALLVPAMALAQTFPSPTFNSLTLQNPLTAANGGTGATTSTGSGSAVLSNSPTLVTPALGTPSAVTLTNGTGLPISTGVSGLGTGVAAGLANAVTGSGSPVLATSPTIASPTVTGAFTATGLVTTADLATQAANTIIGNGTGSTASPTALTMPSCSTSGSGLQWASGTGFACNSAINAATLSGATFAAPGNIGTTTPGNAFFVNLGVGVTSTGAPIDVETSGAVGGSSANATLARFYAGSSGTPITAITPTVGISRYEAVNMIDTEGGQNPALYVQSTGNNTSGGSTIAQVAGITANATQVGGGDAVAVYGTATQAGTLAGRWAYGGFFNANANTAGTNAYAVETNQFNNTGSDAPLTLGSVPSIVGLHVGASGANLNTAGAWFGNNGGGTQFDAGLYFSPGSIKSNTFVDDTSSGNSILIEGSHGIGLNLSAATFSSYSILAPNFSVTQAGAVTATSLSIPSGYTSYTPTLTAASGTYTTASATGSYGQIGKLTCFRVKIIITTVGTGVNPIITLPAAVASTNGDIVIFAGRENALTGKMVQGIVSAAGSNQIEIYNYDNTNPAASGAVIYMNGCYVST